MRISILLLTLTTFVKDYCQATPSMDRQWGKLKPPILSPLCQTLKCSEKVKGGKCYPLKQDGMMCIKSDSLCKELSPNSDCYCCSKELPDRPCTDKGCNEFFQGHGRCTLDATSHSTCVVSDKLCCHDEEEKPCKWTNWLDHDNPSATGDWEEHIPPYSGAPNWGTKIGPGTQCEYPEYRVRIKGSNVEYDDVNDLPGPWIIKDRPDGIRCLNSQQIAIPACEGVQNQNGDKCCPDMEVKYKCCPPPSCSCCMIDQNTGIGNLPFLKG